MIVENMTGAGSLVAANHIFRVRSPTAYLGNINGGLLSSSSRLARNRV